MFDLVSIPLFVPANRPEMFAKAAASGADALILDLEDAVADADKGGARCHLRTNFTSLPVFVRVNSPMSPYWQEDVTAAREAGAAGLVIPKADASEAFAAAAHDAGLPVLALVETARGLADSRRIAAFPFVRKLIFGSIDFCADVGCAHTREALLSARCELVLASRLGGLPAPIDGVTVNFDDAAACETDARHARELGFAGKLCIHPRQIDGIRRGLAPTDDEINWAKMVLTTDGGAAAVKGQMVDEPVRLRARALLERSTAL